MQSLITEGKKRWCSIQKQIYFPSKKQGLIYEEEQHLGKYGSIYADHSSVLFSICSQEPGNYHRVGEREL